LAESLKAIARGRPKPLRQHLEDAEELMAELRQRGCRLVPFPLTPQQKARLLKRNGRRYRD
jgi:hypothetical protein